MSDIARPIEPPQLRITEIFRSLQGESDSVGWPTVFVRLTGCPLRCVYCDTAYAFTGGQRKAVGEIISEVRALNTKEICVTGGEPLAQPACLGLLTQLCDENFTVSLETSGAIDIAEVDPRVRVVMDLKTPSSGELTKNLYTNLDHLKATDEVKFVVGHTEDFQWAHAQIVKYQLDQRFNVLISPVYGEITPLMLADWILATGLRIRMQMQLHKMVWGNDPGH
ncbi:MAG: 7-carboxy-7-deazaguanine synthase QueE [Halothiobacillus sp. 20-53-49]|nr:7-carboxy-7-deazaguanine synthase QueE [Halothiobacillaceae bacterium]OYV46050.1 MAG: 7-carboxy-7-deazaguanine synthase QueE [Halothiobacillus sp. 20-53-49]HUN00063.1 7-carboxy-7-deazaguanine synthase QueE [Halothiobacillus sp.]